MFKHIGKKVLVLLAIAGLVVTGTHLAGKIQKIIRKETSFLAAAGESAIEALQDLEDAGKEISTAAQKEQVTFLLTGIDSALGGSDVIMLASLDLAAGNVRVLQIPRDLYVNRPGSTSHKINSVYANAAAKARKLGKSEKEVADAGNRALRAFLEHNFGVSIDHYLSVNTQGLRKIVDAVGGVTLTVPCDIDYDDESQDLHIHLKAGTQLLDGAKAEQFVRFRSGYKTADYGRMDAQKIFLSAFFKKVKSEFTLPTLLKLASTCMTYTQSDLTAADLIPLIRGAFEVSGENVKMITLKGQSVKDENGTLCEVLCRSYAIDLISEYVLPRGGKAADLRFDPDGVFTAPGEINEIYHGNAPYAKEGVKVSESESIQIQ